MDRRKRLLNNYEKTVLSSVQSAVEQFSAQVFSKVRIADVLDIDHSGLNGEHFRYALQAHFDFVITHGDFPLFAIEFDGPDHATKEDPIGRDNKKKTVCEHLGLPLLRIDSQYLRPVCAGNVLIWLIRLWFYNRLFSLHCYRQSSNALECGSMLSEPELNGNEVSYATVSDTRPARPVDLVTNPFSSSRLFVENLSNQYKLEFRDRRKDHLEYALSVAVLSFNDDQSLIGRGRCQASPDWLVDANELAADLARLDLYDKYHLYSNGEERVIESSGIAEKLLKQFDSSVQIVPQGFVGLPSYITEPWLVY